MNNIDQLNINGTSVLRRAPSSVDKEFSTLILLHGYGADEYDLMGLAAYFDASMQVLSIRGPGSTLYGGASWFDIDMLPDGSLKFNIDQAKVSTDKVVEIISNLKSDGVIPGKRIILGGFSQGATISNLVTLFKPELIEALLIMSGRMPEGAESLVNPNFAFSSLPVFAGHGTNDTVIPIAFGRQIVSFWGPRSKLVHHEYPMGHEISQQELQDIQSWLEKVI